jgi:hypothetical protein
MKGFILRVVAHYGVAKFVNGIPYVGSISRETPMAGQEIINIPWEGNAFNCDSGQRDKTAITVDELISSCEARYRCKIAGSCTKNFYEFEIMEPAWDTADDARKRVDDLTRMLTEYSHGFLDCLLDMDRPIDVNQHSPASA